VQVRRRWILPPSDDAFRAEASTLAARLQLPAAMARVLVGRGHRDADVVRRLLSPGADHLHDPFRMADMDAAVTRLAAAIAAGEHVVVNGDYDTDGVTGTTLLVSELRKLGARVDFFIPDRARDGYGVTARLVRRSGEVGVRVLITVDCGSSDHDLIEEARGLGIDVIVVDHHEIPSRPPHALAVLNPKRADCEYPFKGLSAVGVAFKLLQGVCQRLRPHAPFPEDGLDLVALGTLADVQPVVDENRVLVALGLRRLAETDRPGIQALRSMAKIETGTIGSEEVGFRLAPRINAVGRVARGKLAVDLLLCPDLPTAREMAREVEHQNLLRRELQDRVIDDAKRAAEEYLSAAAEPAALVFASDRWHPGVVGIAAARLAEDYGLPTVLIGIQNGVGRGSARSAGGVDVRAAMADAAAHVERFGGHQQAAGLTIQPDRVADFARSFGEAVRPRLAAERTRPLHIDALLEAGDVTPGLVGALEQLEPFGIGNPEPQFLLAGLHVAPSTRIVGQGHLKLALTLEDGRQLDAIAFRRAAEFAPQEIVGQRLDVVGTLKRQEPRFGAESQVVVSDLRRHETWM
jgi:single-stranded-DNA-specific exonuclease